MVKLVYMLQGTRAPVPHSWGPQWRSAQNENDNVWIIELCSLRTTCLPPSLRASSTTRGQFQTRLKTHYFVSPTGHDKALS